MSAAEVVSDVRSVSLCVYRFATSELPTVIEYEEDREVESERHTGLG